MKKNNVILEVQNLKKYFHNKFGIVNAINGVDFKIHESEVLGLVGESGSGKTTVGRSLIRLYDDFSGFVTLNGKIISGKKLSRENRKYMRRNVQMIFQDPHASLNAQKNIFSILKEPLIINKISHEETSNLMKDWAEVSHIFKMTFENKFQEITNNNLEQSIKIAKQSLKGWEKTFEKLNFDKFYNLSDAFSTYFVYAERKNLAQSQAISYMYENISNLIEFFYEKQNNLRKKQGLDLDEEELTKAKEALELHKKRATVSKEKYELQQQLKAAEEELKTFIKQNKNYRKNVKSLIKSFNTEFWWEYKLQKDNALTTERIDEYLYYKTISLVNLKSYWLLTLPFWDSKNPKNQLLWLKNEEVKSLDSYIKEFNNSLLKQLKLATIEKTYTKDLKKIVHEKHKVDLTRFFDLAVKNKQAFEEEVAKKTAAIESLKTKIAQAPATDPTNAQDLEILERAYKKAQEFNKAEIEKYNKHHKEVQKNLKERFKELTHEWDTEVLGLQKLVDKLYEEKHKEFLEWASVHLSEEQKLSKKEIAETLSQYSQQFKEKQEANASFGKELKVIHQMENEIKYLYGIKKLPSFINKIPFLLKFVTKHVVNKVLVREKIYSALEDVGLLKQFAYRYPHEFSGGQRQRIVIARALITNPKLIIADEPIASLDISIQAQIVNLLKKLAKEKKIGMLFIAHDLQMVEYISDNILIMHLGKIVEKGKTEKIYKRPCHPYTISLFDSIPSISNANEPFKVSSFDFQYLKEQKFPNKPEYYQLENEHEVYGTEKQFSIWQEESKKLAKEFD
ncbi:ATP-binding cassette domain-containing protein [Mycoplasma iguanae]|uniref:ATP-binding cassette domain-containing protein n=1 Tax=Mycoplasma iguanae TaxID=292461 RepID=A0ABY5RA94_9MOLU|nr:ATP-binding cassette domain-containing protein [Mycoplasma iguanae]UVD81682.1 ATP-binding cassette domain-containing protein [Mycoplasma iguanae]